MRPVAWVALAVILVLALGGGVAAYLGKRHADSLQASVAAAFNRGAGELTAGKQSLKQAQTTQSPDDLASASSHFRAARGHFSHGYELATSDWLLRDAGRTELGASYIRPRLEAVRHLRDMGVALADAGDASVALDRQLLSPDPGTGGASAGERLVAALRAAGPILDSVEAALHRAEADARQVDLKVVSSPQRTQIQATLASLATGLQGIDEFKRLTPALLEILGANGKRTYLIEQVNPAELRAGGGFIGSYSVLTAEAGKLQLARSGDIFYVDYPRPNRGEKGYVAPPPATLEFYGDKGWVLGDSNFYPAFDQNAAVGERFTQSELGIKADGIISIDPRLVAQLLSVTGPIAVPSYNITVDAGTLQNQLFDLENRAGLPQTLQRKKLLSEIAAPLIQRVTTLPPGKWAQLMTALNAAAAERDLQIYFNNPAAQEEMSRFGWTGSQNPQKSADYMMEVESNFGGTKANFFVERSWDVTLTQEGGTLRHHVVVDLRDSMPAGRYEGGTYYRFYVRFYCPEGASNVSIGGTFAPKRATDEKQPGLRILDGWQQINVPVAVGHGDGRLTFDYTTPIAGSEHDLYWQKQPGTGADRVKVTWVRDGHTSTATGDLDVDRIIHMTPGGVTLVPGISGSARIPSLSL